MSVLAKKKIDKKSDRIEVLKTYKLFIGGAFPRTESGRYFKYENNGKLANMCRGSRKDLRNSVVAARKAFGSWAGRSAYNRSQILYRIGEMLEGRRAQFESELMDQGLTKTAAKKEVELSIDRLIYFSGWADKYQQVFSGVNPVSSSHFNFSVYEPTGVVFAFCERKSSLLGLVSAVAPVIASGNTIIALASEDLPLCAITFAEVLNSSDVPGGVVNILTGYSDELLEHAGAHLDINAIFYAAGEKKQLIKLKEIASNNVKRVFDENRNFLKDEGQDPYTILNYCEVKTTWHPIEKIGTAGSGY
ncbi:MAG: aldehyde dehydrogenase family protein [Flavobacteriales bacterium]|nr:aldehyde dehydrogenase family protein [Flavobacteriales bacterium]